MTTAESYALRIEELLMNPAVSEDYKAALAYALDAIYLTIDEDCDPTGMYDLYTLSMPGRIPDMSVMTKVYAYHMGLSPID